jgi:hypothetical protein
MQARFCRHESLGRTTAELPVQAGTMGGSAMTKCPKCGGLKLKSLGIGQGEHDDWHSTLISKYRCKVCNTEFEEIQTSEWHIEIQGRPIWQGFEKYIATVYQKLPNNRHRTKHIWFQVKDRSYVEFFRRHPEFNDLQFSVIIGPFEHASCIRRPEIEMAELDWKIQRFTRLFPSPRQQKILAKHLLKMAKRIELGKEPNKVGGT